MVPRMSEISTWQAKAAVTGDIGETLTAQLREADAAALQLVGAQAAYQVGSDKVLKMLEHVEKDREDGTFPAGGSELEVVSYVKKYIVRSSEALLNLKQKAKADELVSHGRVVAAQAAVDVVQKHHTTACSRVAQIAASAIVAPAAEARRETAKGRLTLAERRIARDAPETPKKNRAPRKSRAKKPAPKAESA